MALALIKLFCSDCRENGDLWERPDKYAVCCKICGKEWDKIELNEICHRIKKKDILDRTNTDVVIDTN